MRTLGKLVSRLKGRQIHFTARGGNRPDFGRFETVVHLDGSYNRHCKAAVDAGGAAVVVRTKFGDRVGISTRYWANCRNAFQLKNCCTYLEAAALFEGLRAILKMVKTHQVKDPYIFCSDCQSVVTSVAKLYNHRPYVPKPQLREIYGAIVKLLSFFPDSTELRWVPDRENEAANALALSCRKQYHDRQGSIHYLNDFYEALRTRRGFAKPQVEYIESEALKDVENVDDSLNTLISGLGSKDWVSVCDALNNVRRISIFHKEAIVSMLSDIISLVEKSMKNPRSAVCKTAILTSADIFKAYNDYIIDSLDPLLFQLLLKSSQDKKFVCEVAESALIALTSYVSPLLLLPKLQPYIKNRNPRIRAKTSMCISRCVQRLGVDRIEAFGIDKLIQIGAAQLNDQLPESRDAARTLLLELQLAYEKTPVVSDPDVKEEPVISSWEQFCQSKLSPLSAQAVLCVTNTAREGFVSGS